MYLPTLVNPPKELPVSIATARNHLGVEHYDDNALISGMILAATDHLDGYTGKLGRCLVEQTWVQEYDEFEACMSLRLYPVIGVEAITYTDSAGGAQTLPVGEYEVLTEALGSYVVIKNAPSTDGGRIKIEYKVGYGDASDVPAAIVQAILLHVGSLYEMREREVLGVSLVESGAYQSLITPYKRSRA